MAKPKLKRSFYCHACKRRHLVTPIICDFCKTRHPEGLFKKDGRWACSWCKYGSPMRPMGGNFGAMRNEFSSPIHRIDLQWYDKYLR